MPRREIIFCTKEESKRKQEEAFLRLSGEERLIAFFKMVSRRPLFYEPQVKEDTTINNFVLVKKGQEAE